MATKNSLNSNGAAKKNVRKKQAEAPLVTSESDKRTIFELMAEKRQAGSVVVETPAGAISVKHRITFSDMLMIINTVVDMCTDADTGEVKWEMLNYASKMAVCSSYCGIMVPKNVEVSYSAVCGDDGLYELIKDHIDAEQLNNINNSIFAKLKAREELNNSTAVGKLKELLDNVDSLMKAVSDMSDGLDPDAVAGALSRISFPPDK